MGSINNTNPLTSSVNEIYILQHELFILNERCKRILCLVEHICVSAVACSSQTQLAPIVSYLSFIVSSIKFILRVVGGHIVSVLANRLSNEYQFGPCRFPQKLNISCQILHSPNIDPSSSIDLPNELMINEKVGSYRRARDSDSDDSTSSDSIQRPCRRRSLSIKIYSHSQIADDTECSRVL